jgi:D-threo-aldose 1-dehydrogenase
MYLHDPEFHLTFAEAMAPGGPVQALVALRDQGVLEYLGVAGGAVRLMQEFVSAGLFDAVLSHNRFTLVDRSAGPLLDDAGQRGVAFVNGAPYGGGMLSKGPDIQPKYAYRRAGPAIGAAVRAMQRACAEHGVSLAAAALQFSLRDPRVAATVVGVSEPSRIAGITALMSEQIPGELWAELDALSPAPEFWLN